MNIEQEIRQTKKFVSNKEKALVNLIFTYNWYFNTIGDLFKKHEITSQQYNVLRILRGQFPKSITCGDIKEVMLDKNPDLTRLVDRMIQKDLAERTFNEANRRQVLVKISKKGLKLLEKIDPELITLISTFNLSEREAEQLSQLMDKLRG
jgi:DNA-binding MarR family transcriptional regulator